MSDTDNTADPDVDHPTADPDVDLGAAIAALTATASHIVAHAQSLAFVVLDLLKEVRADLCVPLQTLDGVQLSVEERDKALTEAIGNAKRVIDRIEFALVAHAGIDAGTEEL